MEVITLKYNHFIRSTNLHASPAPHPLTPSVLRFTYQHSAWDKGSWALCLPAPALAPCRSSPILKLVLSGRYPEIGSNVPLSEQETRKPFCTVRAADTKISYDTKTVQELVVSRSFILE